MFGLFPEPFTVVARPDAGISTLTELAGKRVDLGPGGSGSRATMNVVMSAMGWSESDFAYVSDLGMSALTRALCGGEIDAAIVVVASPNLTVEDMVTSCDAVLVPVTDPAIDRLVADNAYHFPFEIPAGTYRGQATSTPTFALAATLVTSSRASPALVYELTDPSSRTSTPSGRFIRPSRGWRSRRCSRTGSPPRFTTAPSATLRRPAWNRRPPDNMQGR